MKLGDKKYKQDKNGKWYINTSYRTSIGEIVRINKRWFDTKADAKEWFASYTDSLESKNIPGKKPFEEFLEEFEQMRSETIANTTAWNCDKSIINKWLMPYFRQKNLEKAFEQTNVMALRKNIESSNISVSRKNCIASLYHSMVDYAYQLLYITETQKQLATVRFPKFKMDKRRKENDDRIPWNEEERNAFMATFDKGTRDYVMFELLFNTAPRLSEFLGLKVENVDLDRCTLEINHQLAYEGYGSVTETDRLKSEMSYRIIPLSTAMRDDLRAYINANGLKGEDYLFTWKEDGKTPISKTNFRKHLYDHCEMAHVRKIVPHAFRHMLSLEMTRKATNMADKEAIAAILGHTPSVDMDIYSAHGSTETARKLIGE